jgi:hypothetical protein
MEINGLDCEWTKVSFFAASTATGITDFKTPSSNNENPEIHFTTAQHAAAQEDLVADVVVDKTGADVGTVQFTFDHILSKIEFRATLNGMSTTDDATTVTVNSVMVTYGAGMWKNGVYTFNTGSNTAIGNWTKGNSLWGASSVCVVMGSSTVLTATSSSVTLGVPMMIIPQKESIITDSPMTVTLSYTIAFNDSKISTQPLEKTYTPSFVLKSSADGGKYFPAYLPGKHYIFNFNISLKAVECEAVGVEKWKEEEEVIDCGC